MVAALNQVLCAARTVSTAVVVVTDATLGTRHVREVEILFQCSRRNPRLRYLKILSVLMGRVNVHLTTHAAFLSRVNMAVVLFLMLSAALMESIAVQRDPVVAL